MSDIAFEQCAALERLIAISKSDTGQSARVANFLLAWWNARDNGGFDLIDLWNVDQAIADDMIAVIQLIARTRCYPDSLYHGFDADFRQMVTDWRRPKRAKKRSAS